MSPLEWPEITLIMAVTAMLFIDLFGGEGKGIMSWGSKSSDFFFN